MLSLKEFKEITLEPCKLNDDYCQKVTGGLDDLSYNPALGVFDDVDDNGITRYSPDDSGRKDTIL